MVSVEFTDMPIRKRGWQTYTAYYVLLISLIFCFLGGSVWDSIISLLRWDISIVDGHALTQSRHTFSSITLDEKLGWRATENYRFDGIKRNFDGTEYHATVSQGSNGFRLFRNVSSGKPRIFVIGDSFTQATDVSDDKTYYAVLKRVLDAEAFGYGVGGYGSLQEFLQF